MRNFKLRTGMNQVHEISKEEFEKETLQKKPYYSHNAKGEQVQFAVCPVCDNPIEICGLYKKLKLTDRPYGKHYGKTIPGLARYNQQAYAYCPYSRQSRNVTPASRKEHMGEYERSIYNLMRDQFDRVIYVLSKQLDIKITNSAARQMLDTYVQTEGWLYPWATLNNLPWVLCHLSWSKSLYGQPVLSKSPLYAAIKESCPTADFVPSAYYEGYENLMRIPRKYLNVEYCLINHKRSIVDDLNVETMELIVSEKNKGVENRFFSKQLIIDERYFLNLVNLPEERARRNTRLLEIARELMPVLE